MNVSEAIETRLELKKYADEPVDDVTKRQILHAGRLASSGLNLQHWRFILIDDEDELNELADRSPTGRWIQNTDFAIVILTDPEQSFNEIDAGRSATYMQLAAWEEGVASRLYTVDQESVLELLDIPDNYDLTVVLGFGYPVREVKGEKDRQPIEEIAYQSKFGQELSI